MTIAFHKPWYDAEDEQALREALRSGTLVGDGPYTERATEELSRLLPALADAIDNGNGNTDGLASSLHLDSLRDRLFGKREADHRPNTTEHGIVDFF